MPQPLCLIPLPRSSAQAIAAAVAALRDGQIVVYPTETFYGLAADPFSPAAMERLFAVKGREAAKTVALIAPDTASAFALASAVPASARKLAAHFWPGPLTLVLPARAGLHDSLAGPDGGVGVRVSPHPIALALATAFGPSADCYQRQSGRRAARLDPRCGARSFR